MTPEEALAKLPNKGTPDVESALSALPPRSELSKFSKVIPGVIEQAVKTAIQQGPIQTPTNLLDPENTEKMNEVLGTPRNVMRTFANTVTNTAQGVRPDVALAQSAMTAFKPDFEPEGVAENVASVGADMADPRNKAFNQIGETVMKDAVIPVTQGIGRQLAKLQNVLTGVPVDDIRMLANKPLEVMTSKTGRKAGTIFQKAKDAAGVTEAEERLIAGIGDPAGYKKVADEMAAKAMEGGLTTGEALAWKKSASELSRRSKGSAKYIYMQDVKKAEKILATQAPDVLSTQADIALSKARSKFLNPLPMNKGGTPAVVRTLLAGGVGTFNPLAAAAFSPLAHLPATLAAGTVNKGLNVIGRNPAIRQALLGILQQIKEREGKK